MKYLCTNLYLVYAKWIVGGVAGGNSRGTLRGHLSSSYYYRDYEFWHLLRLNFGKTSDTYWEFFYTYSTIMPLVAGHRGNINDMSFEYHC